MCITATEPRTPSILAVPGVGLLAATVLIAAAGSPQHFTSGRHLGAWPGLTPKENSSGRRRHLGRISKRGDPYLRMLLNSSAEERGRKIPLSSIFYSLSLSIIASRKYEMCDGL